MKCIHRGRISRVRERTKGRCPGCGSGGTPPYDDACWAGVGAWFRSLDGGGVDADTVADVSAVAMSG